MTRKSPQQKKSDEYANERRYSADSSTKANRRIRPLRKALDRRISRHKVRLALVIAKPTLSEEEAEAMSAAATARPKERNLRYLPESYPLPEWLKWRRSRRIGFTGSNFFRSPYVSEKHRDRFRKFLSDVMSGGTVESVRFARMAREWLKDPADVVGTNLYSSSVGRCSAWLQAFFKDCPEWEERLRRWTEEVAGQTNEDRSENPDQI